MPLVNKVNEKLPDGVPKYLYHFMSKEHYDKILKEGGLGFSFFENSSNGCAGIYMVGKDNLMQHWLGRQEVELFGCCDIGKMLLDFTGYGTKDG